MAKFLFENSFEVDADGNLKPDDKPEALYTEEDLAAARGEAQQIGFAAGKQEALAEIENLVANTLQNIAATLGNMDARHEQAILTMKQDAARLAMVIAGKLAPALIQQQPLDEVKGLIAECLALVPNEPRIVVRVAENLHDHLAEDIDQQAIRGGFQGSVVLLGEPGISGADCRIEWADGGAERDVEALFQQIESAVGRYCANLGDQIAQIEGDIQAAEEQAMMANVDQPDAAEDSGDAPVVTMPEVDEDPFPLPPGSEDVGVVENPLPPLARATTQMPPADGADAAAPMETAEP